MTEFETTIAAPFIHLQAVKLSQMRIVFYYVQDKCWVSVDEAKKLISIAERKGLISRNETGEFVLEEQLRSQKIPLGFKPTDNIFKDNERGVVEILLDLVASRSGKSGEEISIELSEIQNCFDNLITGEGAIAILARKYDIDISPYRKELISQIESND
ncbi:MAG TPA: DUF2240 family protein [Methanocorpusculum sp.]|nr:DUF2240 family protein [Methanocorpusculum sp.]